MSSRATGERTERRDTRPGRRFGVALVVAAAVAVALDVAPAAVPEPTEAPSTLRMAQRLAALADAFEARALPAQPYFSANTPWRIPELRARVEHAGDTRERINAGFELAQQLLWAGRTEEAIGALDGLEQAASGLGADARRRTRDLLRPWRVAADLRLGEQGNCLAHHNPEACLFPLRGGGVHADPTGATAARALLEQTLAGSPDDLAARWLLNLAAMAAGDLDTVPGHWRLPDSAFASGDDVGRFRDIAPASGADIVGLAGGAVMEDLDLDGRLDLVASSWGLRDQLHVLKNRSGEQFEDVTHAAGLDGITGGLNLSHADYDGDGRPDLLVLRGGWLGPNGRFPPSLLRNRPDGVFEDVTEAVGLLDPHPGQTAAWADYDGDGDLDLFLGREWSDPGDPHPSRLFRNDAGRFTDVAHQASLDELGWVKGAAWGDYDNDGRPDLYVSRLAADNLLFHNEGPDAAGQVRFREVGRHAGVGDPRMSFPTWFFDYDNDGWLDLFVGAWDGAGLGQVAAAALGRPHAGEVPRLYHNEHDGRFRDVTRAVGLDRVLLTMGANFGDLDEDGWLDLYLGTGGPDLWLLMPNRMFRNAQGRRFTDVTTSGGFGHLQKGHGIAFGDVDGDGDSDVYAVMGGWYSGDVFPNALFDNPGHGHAWVTLRFRGVRANRFGVGARVALSLSTPAGPRRIHRQVGTGGSFGSSSLQEEIGLGDATSIERIEVRWPGSGTVQRLDHVAPGRVYVVREDSNRLEPAPPPGAASAAHR